MTTNAILATGTLNEMPPLSATRPTESDERRWQAVLARDARHDGEFVFAVETTGVYCCPSCAARRPRRENVRFFPAPEAAERASRARSIFNAGSRPSSESLLANMPIHAGYAHSSAISRPETR